MQIKISSRVQVSHFSSSKRQINFIAYQKNALIVTYMKTFILRSKFELLVYYQ